MIPISRSNGWRAPVPPRCASFATTSVRCARRCCPCPRVGATTDTSSRANQVVAPLCAAGASRSSFGGSWRRRRGHVAIGCFSTIEAEADAVVEGRCTPFAPPGRDWQRSCAASDPPVRPGHRGARAQVSPTRSSVSGTAAHPEVADLVAFSGRFRTRRAVTTSCDCSRARGAASVSPTSMVWPRGRGSPGGDWLRWRSGGPGMRNARTDRVCPPRCRGRASLGWDWWRRSTTSPIPNGVARR